jgi:acyloxyacyl hydrolase
MLSGKGPCIGCTLAIGILEGMAYVHADSIEHVVEKVCKILPSGLQSWCVGIIEVFGPSIIASIENKETPDYICQKIGVCTDAKCHLFPKRKFFAEEEKKQVVEEAIPKLGKLNYEYKIPVADHRPLVDFDGDGFSTLFELRGYAWRGKDCDDWNGDIHPGRVPVRSGDNFDTDYNCNGIKGTNPATGNSYEQDFCAGTKQYGVAILGDSAAAHFAIPPAWVTPALIDGKTYHDLLKILENELDWPDMSSTTGYHVSSFSGNPGPQVSSIYKKNAERNKCAVRDFQNIGVNGARSGSMASGIVQTLSRKQGGMDNPLLINLALIGNDVCNGHHTFDTMTTPQEMYDNTMQTLHYLDTNTIPKGSHLIITGLADGRVLYEGLANRIHPLGTPRNDITYSAFYEYLNCMEASPCWGWMNNNATVRNLTAVRQRELNQVLNNIAANEKFNNFDVIYLHDPFHAIIEKWVQGGGQIYQLIEAVDGFHPSQIANSLIADYVWNLLETQYPHFLPPVNPNNAKSPQVFGDQGGLN